MKSAKVVIGAAFGDEGKGLMTDFFAAQSHNAIVVRFNGGSQAGHTVVTPEGKRHVFSHFGSGTFAGAATYLSQFFIANPIMWRREQVEVVLENPKVFIHPDAPITTPYDMLINQFKAEAMNLGTCGMGINETVVRSGVSSFRITAKDLGYPNLIRAKMENIRDLWVPRRLAHLNLTQQQRNWLINDHVIDNFINDVTYMFNTLTIRGPECLELKDVIFEGAQGLLLDEDHSYFPHVTRSKTGLKNVQIIAAEAGITDLEVFYATRAYTTRHGEGPFPSEDKSLSYQDDTNITNPWQGTLRFGALDLDLIGQAIVKDCFDLKIDKHLVITHMDQVPNPCEVKIAGEIQLVNRGEFFSLCEVATGIKSIWSSRGPTRDDVSTITVM